MALFHTLIMSSMHKILISYPKVGILSPLSPLSLPPHPHPASRIPPPPPFTPHYYAEGVVAFAQFYVYAYAGLCRLM